MPQLVRESEKEAAADDSSGNKNIINTKYAATPSAGVGQNTAAPSSSKSSDEDPKQRLATPKAPPKPLLTSTESQVNSQIKLKTLSKPITKNHDSRIAAAPDNPNAAQVSQKSLDSKNKRPDTNVSAQSRGTSLKAEAKEIEIFTALPMEKLTTDLESADIEAEVTPASMNDDQELAMLTRQQTLIDEAYPSAGVSGLENQSLDLADLPLSFGAHWSLDRRPNPINHKTECILASRAINISDGYDRTDVQLLLTAKSVYVRTASNLDLSYPDTGIRLDNGALMPFEGLVNETAAMISGDVAELYEQIRPNQIVLVRLGFWPTWPVTETQEVSFPLDGIATAIDTLWDCENI